MSIAVYEHIISMRNSSYTEYDLTIEMHAMNERDFVIFDLKYHRCILKLNSPSGVHWTCLTKTGDFRNGDWVFRFSKFTMASLIMEVIEYDIDGTIKWHIVCNLYSVFPCIKCKSLQAFHAVYIRSYTYHGFVSSPYCHISQTSSLRPPYGICGESTIDWFDPGTSYDRSRCTLQCSARMAATKCGCIDVYMPGMCLQTVMRNQ